MAAGRLALTLSSTELRLLCGRVDKQIGVVVRASLIQASASVRRRRHGCQVQPRIPSSLSGGAPGRGVCDPVDSPSTLRLDPRSPLFVYKQSARVVSLYIRLLQQS